VIISRRTYSQRCDLTPESALPRTEGEVERRLRVSTVGTTSLRIERSASTSIVVFTYNSSNLEEARRTVKQQGQLGESQKGGDKKPNFRPSISEPAEKTSGNSNNSNNSNNPDPGNSKSVKSNKPSGGSRANLSPAPGLSKEVYESQKPNR